MSTRVAAAPRHAKPASIYRRNKQPKGAAEAAQRDSDESDEEIQEPEEDADVKDIVQKDGLIIRRERDAQTQLKVKEIVKPKLVARPIEEDVKPDLSTPAPAAESEYETDTEEEESSEEEEEERPKPLYKPVFVAKRNRETVPLTSELQRIAEEEADEKRRQDQKLASHNLVEVALERELADKDKPDVFPDVDDTDGLDPEGEFEAWKLRELMRIKRDRDALYEREREKEEVEQRRAMPEQLRLKEDLEHAQKTRDSKAKGNQVFLQKYFHKGVFYTEDDLMQRDYSAPTEGTVMDMASLPAAMQNRKFGKRSQSKYTHLRDQDTTSNEAGWTQKQTAMSGSGFKQGDPGFRGSGGQSSGCFNCGGPHLKRDCPEMQRAGPTGANDSGPQRDSGWSDRSRARGRSRSRSPSPRRDRDNGASYRRERSRSRSPDRDRYDRDKRRRY